MVFPGKPFQGSEHKPFYMQGADAAALFVHGFPGTPAEMRPLAERLHAQGWTVQGILLPGFGPEIENIPEKRVSDWTFAVEEAMNNLRRQHRLVVLIGYSLGGALALQTAVNTDPDGLVLLAPFWKIDHVLWKMIPLLKRVFNGVQPFRLFKPDFTDPQMRAGILNFMPDANLDDPQVQQAIRDFRLPLSLFEQIHQAGHAAYKLASKLPGSLPVLVLQGTADDLVRPELTRHWINHFSGQVEYQEVAGKHDLPKPDADAWPTVVDAVTQFALRLQPSPA